MSAVTMHDVDVDLPALVDRAHAGEEIILAKAGKPYAKLGPIEAVSAQPPRTPGRLKGLVGHIPDSVWFDPLPDDELDLWEGKHKHYP